MEFIIKGKVILFKHALYTQLSSGRRSLIFKSELFNTSIVYENSSAYNPFRPMEFLPFQCKF